MRNYNSIAPLSLNKDFVADQTVNNVQEKLNTSGLGFDVTEGYGYSAASTSSGWVMSIGGFNNQRATAVMKYVSPTTAGSEDIGVMLRCTSLDSPNASYYYARVDAGDAEIVRVLNGTFTTLSTTAFALPANELVTITFTAVDSTLSATFVATTPSDVSLSTTDSNITGGLPGARSLNSTIRCRSLNVEQLP